MSDRSQFIDDLLIQNHSLKDRLDKAVQGNGFFLTQAWDSFRNHVWGENEDTANGFQKVLDENEKHILEVESLFSDPSKRRDATKLLGQIATININTGRYELRLATKFDAMMEHYLAGRSFIPETANNLGSTTVAAQAFTRCPGTFANKSIAAVGAGALSYFAIKGTDGQIKSASDIPANIPNSLLPGGLVVLWGLFRTSPKPNIRSDTPKGDPPPGGGVAVRSMQEKAPAPVVEVNASGDPPPPSGGAVTIDSPVKEQVVVQSIGGGRRGGPGKPGGSGVEQFELSPSPEKLYVKIGH
jgi:hypothetical protein